MGATEDTGLREQVRGRVLVPGDRGWTREVTGFNATVAHRPDVVVVAEDAADVQAAVRYAASARLPVAVHATGHGPMEPFEGGVLVNTGELTGVKVDAHARTASVGAGATWRPVIDAAAPLGLATLNGSSSAVSVAGFVLGGGLPVLGRTFGFAADHVLSLDVVTADGDLRTVTADSEPDLFWGLRGGGGNLGIVTSLTVDLVPVTTMYAGGMFYAAEQVPAVLRAWCEWSPGLPEHINTSVAILRLPPHDDVPEVLRGGPVAHVRFCAVAADGGPVDVRAASDALAPMRAAAPVLLDSMAEGPYAGIDRVHMDPEGPIPFWQRGALLRDLDAAAIDALLAVAGPGIDVPLVVCELRRLGGALARPPRVDNAIGGRDAGHLVSAVGVCAPEIAAAARTAVDEVMAALAPWGTGHTLLTLHGAIGDEADRARAWDAAAYERLCGLVTRYDPDGMFCHGHAIARSPQPAGS